MKNDIGFIAIGQAGGNIGLLFEKHGYNVLFINTSKEDLDTLKEVKHTIHIKNGEGCNKDRDKAKDLIIEDFDAIASQINEKLTEEFIFVIFSSGGGTGSGASPMLIELLIQNSSKKIGVITILPSDSETLKAYINSYECFRELENIDNMGATFVLDNNKGDKLTINNTFVEVFNAFVQVPSYKSVRGNIDKAEAKEMLSTRGTAIISKMGKNNNNSTARLIKLLHENVFVPVEPDRVIKYIGLSAVTRIDVEAITKEFGTCLDVFHGINPTHTVCMLCGLTYPYTALERIKNKVEGSRENITKNVNATHGSKLSDGINFLTRPTPVSTTTKADTKDIFAKYKRK